ncbi:protein JINGUBANG-like [Olea europaea var. sylvestris]|uniref:protein JINGUBANG-like n=1 Tax=Olea europaea var. sylvestris TaxID=158386 RepID=UPI000C1D2863|nr:protein JINGUBANG-like [Olea europaea var. sylvestris]
MRPDDQTCSASDDSPPLLPDHQLVNAHHQCLATLEGQNSYTTSLVLMGKFLLSGSSNKEICLWKRNSLSPMNDSESLTDKNMVVAGKGAVKALVVLADKIISAHQDHKIRVWKIDNLDNDEQKFTQLATLPTFSDRALKLLVPKNHVQVRRHKKCTWVHHVDTVSALALSNDESLLYSVSWDRTLKIWRISDFKCLESVANAHDDAINAIALASDGHVYTGSSDKKIKIWKRSTENKKHTLVATLEKHKSGVNAVALSRDGLTMYSGARDRSILVWKKVDESCSMVTVGTLRGHTESILCLATISDMVCSGSADKTVRIWRGFGKSYSCLAVLEGHRGPVKCIAVTLDYSNPSETKSNYLLYSASLNCDIKVWQINLLPLV